MPREYDLACATMGSNALAFARFCDFVSGGTETEKLSKGERKEFEHSLKELRERAHPFLSDLEELAVKSEKIACGREEYNAAHLYHEHPIAIVVFSSYKINYGSWSEDFEEVAMRVRELKERYKEVLGKQRLPKSEGDTIIEFPIQVYYESTNTRLPFVQLAA